MEHRVAARAVAASRAPIFVKAMLWGAVLGCLFLNKTILASAGMPKSEMAGAWIDLPRAAHAGALDGEATELLERYHALPKDTLEGARERIELLADFAQRVGQGASMREKHLGLHAIGKAQYLMLILEVHARRGTLKTFPAMLFENEAHGSDTTRFPLVNQIMFDTQMPAYWGLFQLEVLDPCHRLFLTESYVKWREANVDTPFFLWLETHGTFSFKELQVIYLGKDDLARAKVTCALGLLQDANGVTLSTQEGAAYLYVLTLQKALLVVRGDETIHHTSLTHGRSVLGAGTLKAQDGMLTYIDTQSGHYFPTGKSLLLTLRTLEDQGLFINWHTLQVGYYKEGVKCETSAYDMRDAHEHEKGHGTNGAST